jgi:hypothetical protein
VVWIFICRKNPSSSAGFKIPNLESCGKHGRRCINVFFVPFACFWHICHYYVMVFFIVTPLSIKNGKTHMYTGLVGEDYTSVVCVRNFFVACRRLAKYLLFVLCKVEFGVTK